jgi:ABC-type spermidine/putrescine transport system permease subunit II
MTPPDPTAVQPIDLRARMSWRVIVNHAMTAAMLGAVVLIAIPLVLVLWSLLARGASAAFADFPAFFTKDIPHMDTQPGGGMGPAIVGTLLVTGGAALLAIPLGILGAVYLHEYGKSSTFARLVRFLSVVMTGVPSIVMGLFVYIMWTMRFGYSAFGGSIAMACLMLPVVIRATEQMLELVPAHLREASYALGTTKSRTIVTVVLPAALHGRRGERDQRVAVLGREHRAVGADLRERDVVVPRGAGPRVGRRAHARAADVRDHADRACVHRAHREEVMRVIRGGSDGHRSHRQHRQLHQRVAAAARQRPDRRGPA